MVSLYQFEPTDRLSDQYPVPALRVHAAVGCGRAFSDVAAVLEPESVNPCLVLNKPLGVNGVQAILDMLAQRKCPGISVRGQLELALSVIEESDDADEHAEWLQDTRALLRLN